MRSAQKSLHACRGVKALDFWRTMRIADPPALAKHGGDAAGRDAAAAKAASADLPVLDMLLNELAGLSASGYVSQRHSPNSAVRPLSRLRSKVEVKGED